MLSLPCTAADCNTVGMPTFKSNLKCSKLCQKVPIIQHSSSTLIRTKNSQNYAGIICQSLVGIPAKLSHVCQLEPCLYVTVHIPCQGLYPTVVRPLIAKSEYCMALIFCGSKFSQIAALKEFVEKNFANSSCPCDSAVAQILVE